MTHVLKVPKRIPNIIDRASRTECSKQSGSFLNFLNRMAGKGNE